MRCHLLLLSVFFGFMASAALSSPPSQDIKKYSTYLSGMKSFQASFVQISPQGGESQGTIYMKKPRRLRVVYTPPHTGIELIADGERLIHYDKNAQESDSMRLEETPLYFLLSDGKLEDHVIVEKVFHGKGKTAIMMVDKDDPEGGAVTLVFQDDPVCLLQWQVVDGNGSCTTVILSHMKKNIAIPDNIFRMKSQA